MRLLARVVACAGAALVAACGLGVNGLEPAGLDAGTSGADAPAEGTGGGHDASTDVTTGDGPGLDVVTFDTTGGDVVADTKPQDVAPQDGCVPKGPENCTNGADDDCNGLTDCADPACASAGYACVPAVPTGGWSFVAFDATGRPACPQTLMPKNYDIDPTDLASLATCGCTCSVGQAPSCTGGSILANYGPDNTCGGGGPPTLFGANNGNCDKQSLQVEPFVLATATTTGGTCNPQATTNVPTTGATQGEACEGENQFGAGCSVAGDVCALAPTGFLGCILHGGQSVCPLGGYGTRHSAGMIADTRGCNACQCGATPTATCTGTWTFYDNANCMGGTSLPVKVDGKCDATGGDGMHLYLANQLAASPSSPACANPPAPTPKGNVQLNAEDTVCCQ